MQLLEDTFIIENLQVINEGAGSGPMKIRGCFQRADEANNNKRIYSKTLLDREITKLAESISERRLMGELDHPQHDSVKLSNVSHLITGLKMKGTEVIGEAEILDTPSGKVAKALIEGGVKVGISSRGMGTVSEDLDGTRHVNEDFRLITWDLVADPSTRGAYPDLTESTQIQEIIDRVYPEAQKIKNFTTLLKEELVMEAQSPDEKGRAAGVKEFEAQGGGTRGVWGGTAALMKAQAQRTPNWERAERLRSLKGTVLRKTVGVQSPVRRAFRSVTAKNDSTQFVNFMRDRLMEAKKDPHATTFEQDEARRKKLEDTIKYSQVQKKKAEAKKQNSSTQFVNFMRDKLMETRVRSIKKDPEEFIRKHKAAVASGKPIKFKLGPKKPTR